MAKENPYDQNSPEFHLRSQQLHYESLGQTFGREAEASLKKSQDAYETSARYAEALLILDAAKGPNSGSAA